MSQDICTQCGTTLPVPEAPCPQCGAGASDASPDDWMAEPAWQSVYRGLRTYRMGLILQFIGQVGGNVLGVVLIFLFLSFVPDKFHDNSGATSVHLVALTVVAVSTTLLLVVALVAMLLGLYRVAAVPAETGARGLAWTAFATGIVAVLCTLALLFLGKDAKASTWGGVIDLLRILAWLTSTVTFLLALRPVARAAESPSLGRNAAILIVLHIVQGGLVRGHDWVTHKLAAARHTEGWSHVKESDLQGLSVFLLVGIGVVGLVYLMRFMSLLSTLSAVIGKEDYGLGDDPGEAPTFKFD